MDKLINSANHHEKIRDNFDLQKELVETRCLEVLKVVAEKVGVPTIDEIANMYLLEGEHSFLFVSLKNNQIVIFDDSSMKKVVDDGKDVFKQDVDKLTLNFEGETDYFLSLGTKIKPLGMFTSGDESENLYPLMSLPKLMVKLKGSYERAVDLLNEVERRVKKSKT